MATFAVQTATGVVVGLIKAQEDAPPPSVSGDPGYLVSPVDIPEGIFGVSEPDAEVNMAAAFEQVRNALGSSGSP